MNGRQIQGALARFFLGSYLLVLLLCAPFLRRAWLPSAGSGVYALLLVLAQAALYLLPAFLLTELVRVLLLWRREGASAGVWRRALVQATALLGTTLTAVALAADARIVEIFGFHLNGFVLNLLATPGGVESMGLGRDGVLAFARALGGIASVELLLLWGAHRIGRSAPAAPGSPRLARLALAGLAAVALSERATYAVGEARSQGAILEQANAFPL